ncbi:AMIN-like domain-containing (lipo)protein [Kribbella sp. NPDC054772]
MPEASNRARATTSPTSVANIRTGRHDCFDRLVVDLAGGSSGYDVRYVRTVSEDGSGRLVPLRGGARLQIVVRAPSYNVNTGQATYAPRNRQELTTVAGYRTFRQVAFAGSFEGQTNFGLGGGGGAAGGGGGGGGGGVGGGGGGGGRRRPPPPPPVWWWTSPTAGSCLQHSVEQVVEAVGED